MALRVGEHTVDQAQRVVPGGAGGGPGRRQPFAGLEDLLDQDVGAAGDRGQVVEVAAGVAQAVGMVDPQPVDQAFVEPAADLDVRVGEHLRVLDADRGERVHGEEAPVVEAGVGDLPVHELVVLAIVDRVRVGAVVRRSGREREPVIVVAELVVGKREVVDPAGRSESQSSSPTTGIRMRSPPASQSTSKAVACADPRPSRRSVPPPAVVRRGRDADVVRARCRRAHPSRGVGPRPRPPPAPSRRRAPGRFGRARPRRTRGCCPPRPGAGVRGRPSPRRARAGTAAGARPRTGRTPR